MDLTQLATALGALGCPPEKCSEMAAMLDKRARQFMEQRGWSYEQAMSHLLSLLREGWAAQERGL